MHEAIHVMQRVLRKDRSIHYVYEDEDGRCQLKNPVRCVRVGVEDELEVQSILVRAGHPFSLNPILHHRKSLELAFSQTSPQETERAMREGLEAIPFGKYEHLQKNLRETVLAAYLPPA